MRRQHLHAFRPVCPACRGEALTLRADVEAADEVLDGFLDYRSCGADYPILAGVPVIVPDPRTFLANNLLLATSRDVPEPLSAWLGRACGQGSAWDANRQHLSSYGADHYGPDGGRAIRLLDAARPPGGRLALDLGCGPGATSHALADDHQLVLGVDLHLGLLRLAHQVLHTGVARFPVRTSGLGYRLVEAEVHLRQPERVDFWCCDATALPFADASVDTATSLNLVDCVPSPTLHLQELHRVLAPGGHATLATPFDWAPHVTPPAHWLDGDGLVGALPEGLELRSRQDAPWGVFIHDRRTSSYEALLLALQKT